MCPFNNVSPAESEIIASAERIIAADFRYAPNDLYRMSTVEGMANALNKSEGFSQARLDAARSCAELAIAGQCERSW